MRFNVKTSPQLSKLGPTKQFQRSQIENAESLKSDKTGQFCTVHEIEPENIVNELQKFSNLDMS